MEGKLDYKHALKSILPLVSQETEQQKRWLWESILPNLEDQKVAIDFALNIVQNPRHNLYEHALKFLLKKIGIKIEEGTTLQYLEENYLHKWGLEVLEEKLESISNKREMRGISDEG